MLRHVVDDRPAARDRLNALGVPSKKHGILRSIPSAASYARNQPQREVAVERTAQRLQLVPDEQVVLLQLGAFRVQQRKQTASRLVLLPFSAFPKRTVMF